MIIKNSGGSIVPDYRFINSETYTMYDSRYISPKMYLKERCKYCTKLLVDGETVCSYCGAPTREEK